jgi:hemerythrin HHE cation binding domain-containing protein
MNSLLKRWFGRGEQADRASASQHISAVRPRGDYRPELIPTLQGEHRELLALFAELEKSSERGDESACRAALDRFTRVLQDHLLTENRHLYGYFSRHGDPDPDVARQVEAMSSDMMRVGKILHRFITTYTRATWSSALQAQLRKDLRPIGEVLAHRIHEEEAVLYPLYAPRAS